MKSTHTIHLKYTGQKMVLLLIAVICFQTGVLHADQSLRIGFSRSVVGDVNENDALAVIKVWARALVLTENLSIDPQPQIYTGIGEMETALQKKQVECISITASEFFRLQHLLDRKKFIFPVRGGSMTEEFLLLVRRGDSISEISDLEGATLNIPGNANSDLSIIWLDVQLAKAGLPPAKRYFGQLNQVKKISAAVLPVFFGKAKACLVTRKGFETMAELNPQISRRLKILSASTEYVPNFLGFREDYQSWIKEIVLKKIEQWDQAPASRQILTIFQTDALRQESFERLKPTLELIEEHQRLLNR